MQEHALRSCVAFMAADHAAKQLHMVLRSALPMQLLLHAAAAASQHPV
jgi:hypothetical protein